MNAYGQLKLWYANSEIRTPSFNPATFNQFTYDSYIITVSRVWTVPFFWNWDFCPIYRRHLNPLYNQKLISVNLRNFEKMKNAKESSNESQNITGSGKVYYDNIPSLDGALEYFKLFFGPVKSVGFGSLHGHI